MLTYNIRDGGKGREHIILDILTTIQPDLILLQEVTYPEIVEQWARALGVKAVVASGNTYRHVAILSRYPVLASRSHAPVPKLSRDFLEVLVEYQSGQVLKLFCVHLTAQPFMPFEWMRLVEINAILRQATKPPASQLTLPCLIAGDFSSISPMDKAVIHSFPKRLRTLLLLQANHLPHMVNSRMLTAQFVDCYRALHSDPGFTLPTPHPTVRYDYLFANSVLLPLLQRCYVVRQLSAVDHASDHYPVVAEFGL